MNAINILTASHTGNYSLLDSGGGFKLEQWGPNILARPEPQAVWLPHLGVESWDMAHAKFTQGWMENGFESENWLFEYEKLQFKLKLSPFKHTGIFPEQVAHWTKPANSKQLTANKRKTTLNLFAYTGLATCILAKAGYTVTHVDASKPSITWANDNYDLNNLPKENVRWILDDCSKYVTRLIKRETTFDGIILDPPAFGHSPKGATWKYEREIFNLLSGCIQVLSDKPDFLVINSYATNTSALALGNILEDALQTRPDLAKHAQIEIGELCLPHQNSGRLLSTGVYGRLTFKK